MSMRAWQARALGPGNDYTYRDVFSIPSQIGDFKLEANVEYRFPLFWKLEGALFLDTGNIWDLPSPYYNDEGTFAFDTLGESFAMDWGPGIRVNLDFLLLRLDLGFRVHDPARDEGDRWLGPGQWFKKDNLAVHFGVGYPF
jgi:outer membrane protein assembly factor BamA